MRTKFAKQRSSAALRPTGCALLIGVGALLAGGCESIPRDDIRTFLVDLAPRSSEEPNEEQLAQVIRQKSAIDGFEFADDVNWDDLRVPRIVSHFLTDLEPE